jgi:hypothetical protein
MPVFCPALIDYRSVSGTLIDKARGEMVLYKTQDNIQDPQDSTVRIYS